MVGIELEAFLLAPDGAGGFGPVVTPGAHVYGAGPLMDPDGVLDAVLDAADRADIEIEGSDELKVKAPSGGLFYAAASPNDPPFVRAGDIVSREKTLCLIEAMKLFRSVSLASLDAGAELFSGHSRYEVTRVNAANGQVVNQGDLLFVVRPAGD